MKKLLAGLTIEGHKPGVFDPPLVVVHKLGSDLQIWLTPAEARALAKELEASADKSEEGL